MLHNFAKAANCTLSTLDIVLTKRTQIDKCLNLTISHIDQCRKSNVLVVFVEMFVLLLTLRVSCLFLIGHKARYRYLAQSGDQHCGQFQWKSSIHAAFCHDRAIESAAVQYHFILCAQWSDAVIEEQSLHLVSVFVIVAFGKQSL